MADQKTQAMNPEQAADLAALESLASPTNQAGDAPAGQQQMQMRPELQAELSALFMLAAQTVGTIYPSVKETCNQQAIDALAAVWSAVCNKRGWLQGGIGGEYAEEIAAAAVTLPLGFAMYKGIQADIQARQRESKPAEQQSIAPVMPQADEAAGLDASIKLTAAVEAIPE